MCKALEVSNQILDNCTEFRVEYDNIRNEVSKYDKMMEDLLHRIELGTFNACEGYKLCKQIQDTRKSRRVVKNKLETLQSMISLIDSLSMKIKNINAEIKRIEIMQEKRIYAPRILKNIM